MVEILSLFGAFSDRGCSPSQIFRTQKLSMGRLCLLCTVELAFFLCFFFSNDFRVILIFVVHYFEEKKLAWRIGFFDQNKLFLAMCESDIIKYWPFNVYVWAASEWSFIENRLLCLVFRKISQRSCHFHYNGGHAHILKRKVINNVITAIFDQ